MLQKTCPFLTSKLGYFRKKPTKIFVILLTLELSVIPLRQGNFTDHRVEILAVGLLETQKERMGFLSV